MTRPPRRPSTRPDARQRADLAHREVVAQLQALSTTGHLGAVFWAVPRGSLHAFVVRHAACAHDHPDVVTFHLTQGLLGGRCARCEDVAEGLELGIAGSAPVVWWVCVLVDLCGGSFEALRSGQFQRIPGYVAHLEEALRVCLALAETDSRGWVN